MTATNNETLLSTNNSSEFIPNIEFIDRENWDHLLHWDLYFMLDYACSDYDEEISERNEKTPEEPINPEKPKKPENPKKTRKKKPKDFWYIDNMFNYQKVWKNRLVKKLPFIEEASSIDTENTEEDNEPLEIGDKNQHQVDKVRYSSSKTSVKGSIKDLIQKDDSQPSGSKTLSRKHCPTEVGRIGSRSSMSDHELLQIRDKNQQRNSSSSTSIRAQPATEVEKVRFSSSKSSVKGSTKDPIQKDYSQTTGSETLSRKYFSSSSTSIRAQPATEVEKVRFSSSKSSVEKRIVDRIDSRSSMSDQEPLQIKYKNQQRNSSSSTSIRAQPATEVDKVRYSSSKTSVKGSTTTLIIKYDSQPSGSETLSRTKCPTKSGKIGSRSSMSDQEPLQIRDKNQQRTSTISGVNKNSIKAFPKPVASKASVSNSASSIGSQQDHSQFSGSKSSSRKHATQDIHTCSSNHSMRRYQLSDVYSLDSSTSQVKIIWMNDRFKAPTQCGSRLNVSRRKQISKISSIISVESHNVSLSSAFPKQPLWRSAFGSCFPCLHKNPWD